MEDVESECGLTSALYLSVGTTKKQYMQPPRPMATRAIANATRDQTTAASNSKAVWSSVMSDISPQSQ